MPSVVRQYKDVDLSFTPHPASGDISVLQNSEAVKAAVRNVILTGFYEKHFRPGFGSGVSKLLFENINPLTQESIKIAIQDSIRSWEPRAEVVDVEVSIDRDEQGYYARIQFAVDAASEVVTVNVFLERVR